MFENMDKLTIPSITGNPTPIGQLSSWHEMQNKVEAELEEIMCIFDIEDTNESRAPFIAMLQNLGVDVDGCSHCGAMPMNSNCNNAECDV